MQRAPVTTFLSLSRRGYAAAAAATVAEAKKQHRAPAAMTARVSDVKGGGSDAAASSEEVFWMRHPETGCWVPQDRFADDVDAAELRARLLGGKN